MSDARFPYFSPSGRQRNGPLAEERHRYLAYLAGQGLSPKTLRSMACYLLTIAYSLRLAQRPGELISPGEIRVHAARWARRRPRPPRQKDPRFTRPLSDLGDPVAQVPGSLAARGSPLAPVR